MGQPPRRPERQTRAIAHDLTREESFFFFLFFFRSCGVAGPDFFSRGGLGYHGRIGRILLHATVKSRQPGTTAALGVDHTPCRWAIAHCRPAQEDSGSIQLGSIAVEAMAGRWIVQSIVLVPAAYPLQYRVGYMYPREQYEVMRMKSGMWDHLSRMLECLNTRHREA